MATPGGSTDVLRPVMVAKTGSGKSSLGNTLLGKDKFKTEDAFAGGTFFCQWEGADRFGLRLEVTDTPGVSDSGRDMKKVLKEITKCIVASFPGPHAVLMVLRCDRRFTAEEHEAYRILKALFGDEICKYMIIVFVGTDTFGGTQVLSAEREKRLAESILKAPETLRKILTDAEQRYCSVDNNASREDRDKQAEIIVRTIQKLVSQNGNTCFTSGLVERVNKRVRAEAKRRVAEGENKTFEDAIEHIRQNILDDLVDPGFFLALIEIVQEFLQRVGVALSGMSRCSVM